MGNFARLIPALFLLSACGGAAVETTTTPVTLTIPALTAENFEVQKIVLTVTGADMTTIKATKQAPFAGDIQFGVDVPVGNDRTFVVRATVADETKQGFHKSATTNVLAGGVNVPLTLNFVNFMEHATDHVISETGPNFEALEIAVDGKETTDTADDRVEITVDIGHASQDDELYLECNTDAKTTTGSPDTAIHRLAKTAFTTDFTKGSEIFLGIRYSLSTQSVFPQGLVFNAVDDSQITSKFATSDVDLTATGEVLTSDQSGTDIRIDVSMLKTGFLKFFDEGDGKGVCNIIAGTNPSHFSIGDFVPNDISLLTGAIEYDLAFDLSSL